MIRTAKAEDAPAIATIHIESWRHVYDGVIPADFLASLSISKRMEQWRAALKKSVKGTLVHETDGVVAGWTSFGPCLDTDRKNAADYELYAIYVHPARLRQGVGRALAAELETRCRKHCARSISLWVLAANQRARAFYHSLGYTHDGSAETVSIGGAPFEKYRYVKRMG